MLLRIYLLFLLNLTFTALFANDSTLNWQQWKKSWEKREISTSRINVRKQRNLIKKVIVLDIRSDTERVEIYTNSFHNPCEVVFDIPIDNLLNNKLSNDTASETILLVIRNFWINEVQAFENRSKAYQPLTGHALPSSKLTCSIDAFIKRGEKYSPLSQFDTIFTDKRKVPSSSRDLTEKVLLLIQSSFEEAIVANKYLIKKQVDKEFIEKVYSRRFKIAAITDSSFQKGIYYTWEQFKNNRPTKKEFSIKSNKKEPPSLFIIDENGNEILSRNVFAVSDGNNLYKIHQGFVFPIYRNNNGIYWTGLEKFDLKTQGAPVGFALAGGISAYGLEPVGTVMKIRVSPYLLNIETGKEY